VRRVTLTCPKPCGRPAGRMQVLCEEHERVVARTIQQRMFSADEFDEVQQMVYERLLGPAGLRKFVAQKAFHHWLRDQARLDIRAYIARQTRKHPVGFAEGLLCPPPPDPESRRILHELLGRARAIYVDDDDDARFEKARFFDCAVFTLECMWRVLGPEDYMHLRGEFPRAASESEGITNSDPNAYLRQRVKRLRNHVQAVARTTGEQRP
jgi:hypothetical protein